MKLKYEPIPRKKIEVPHPHTCVSCDLALVCVNPHCSSNLERPLCEGCWQNVAAKKPPTMTTKRGLR